MAPNQDEMVNHTRRNVMSISGISSSSYNYDPFSKIKDDFKAISTALNSGNLTDAQKAYTTLKSDTSSVKSDSNNPMAKDIQSLGSALDSGSLSDAQQTLAGIQKHLNGHGEFARQQMEMQSALNTDDSSSSTSGTSSSAAGNLGQDLQTLMTALQSGNLSDAQKAYASLQQDVSSQNGGQSDDPFSKDLQSLGDSLSSGNLSEAQTKMSQIQEKMSSRPMGPPPGPPPSDTSTSASNSTSGSDSLKDDLETLAEALQSGNLSDAQKAFASLQSHLASDATDSSESSATSEASASGSIGSSQHHHRHHGETAAVASSSSSSSATDTGTTATGSSSALSDSVKNAIISYLQSSYRDTDTSLLSATDYL